MRRLILSALAPAAAWFGAFAPAAAPAGAAFEVNTHTTLRFVTVWESQARAGTDTSGRSSQDLRFVGPTPTPMGFRFEYATPESQGMSTAGLEALRVFSNQLYPDNGILVMRFDKVVLEQYHGQTTITKRRSIYSATKSFGAALVIKAIDDGLLSLTDPACGEPGMTAFHLASFTGGLMKAGSSQCDNLLFPIGTDWAYSDGSANRLAEEVGAHYPGVDLVDLMRTEILEPIGATNFRWPNGLRFSSGISMDTRGMALYGRLWLRGGNWYGNQILPNSLVSQFTTASNPSLKEDYGHLWWVNSEGPAAPFNKYGFNLGPIFPTNAPTDAFLATGCQYDLILVVPSLELVVARVGTSDGGCIDSGNSGTTEASDNNRQFIELAMDAVLSATATATPAASPTPSATPSATPMVTPTPTASATLSVTPTPTAVAPTPTAATPAPTAVTPTPTAITPTPTAVTPTPTAVTPPNPTPATPTPTAMTPISTAVTPTPVTPIPTPTPLTQCQIDCPLTTVTTVGGQGSAAKNVIVTHAITGFVCGPLNIAVNASRFGICKDSTVNIMIFDTSGIPTTRIREGPLVTNGTNTVSGTISAKSRYDSTSQNGLDTDRMTIEACVDADTHATCQP